MCQVSPEGGIIIGGNVQCSSDSRVNVIRDHIIRFSHAVSEKTEEARDVGVEFLLNTVDFGVLRQAQEAESAPGSVASVTGLPSDHLPLQFTQADDG